MAPEREETRGFGTRTMCTIRASSLCHVVTVRATTSRHSVTWSVSAAVGALNADSDPPMQCRVRPFATWDTSRIRNPDYVRIRTVRLPVRGISGGGVNRHSYVWMIRPTAELRTTLPVDNNSSSPCSGAGVLVASVIDL